MAHDIPKIKVVVAAGVPVAEAIKAALPCRLNEFAARHGLARTAVSMCIHGRQRHERVRALLAAELGVEREWLDRLLDGARTRSAASEAAA